MPETTPPGPDAWLRRRRSPSPANLAVIFRCLLGLLARLRTPLFWELRRVTKAGTVLPVLIYQCFVTPASDPHPSLTVQMSSHPYPAPTNIYSRHDVASAESWVVQQGTDELGSFGAFATDHGAAPYNAAYSSGFFPQSHSTGPERIKHSASRSTSRSLSASVGAGGRPDDKLRKSKLSPEDQLNIETAVNFYIIDAIESGNWPKPDSRYLTRANIRNRHETPWEQGMADLILNQVQTFRSKMVKFAEEYARMYDLASRVDRLDPGGGMQPAERTNAIHSLCERVLLADNWTEYILHEVDIHAGKFNLFSNPIFLSFHNDFWYTHPVSPISRKRDMPWNLPPLRLLTISGAALSCGLRRVWQPDLVLDRRRRNHDSLLCYSVKYHILEKEIHAGMSKSCVHECPKIRGEFQEMLREVHQNGLKLKAKYAPAVIDFFIPSASEINLLRHHPYAQLPGTSSAVAGPSSLESTVYRGNDGWVLTP
ncbi:hypothetical protein EV363DRAFT_1179699 [Boletus edulis]|uniref:DUF6532 domain-containing protein n=1 Tax=Boletus edulis BED1 TaxID=1328754 RepID=A0AAD4G6D9_BOLED|nr:hypothetical protein EV363DRAFT_1409928 [Boletus edulis]KAF8120048.1 hypothetical protein EV363DRAFT_1193025 [Boletus edulis]KAF8120232.1 hypothetical protein EV363DRAFT_1191689 [Boletus edulis]KAF8123633.1 hypothetical protein EV363DRAFT_1179699 [Boletus edulis]KAF8420333.1 hypothetical protein L210DRAFT_3510474 [Boletus edulis BED1]